MDNNISSVDMNDDYPPLNETFDTPFTFEPTRILFIILYVAVFITCVTGKCNFCLSFFGCKKKKGLDQELISVRALVFDLSQLTCQKRFDCRNAVIRSSETFLDTS